MAIAYSSDRTSERGLHVAFGCVWTAAGMLWIALPPASASPFVRYAGVLFTQAGIGTTIAPLNAAWLSTSIPSNQRPLALAALLVSINSTGFFQACVIAQRRV